DYAGVGLSFVADRVSFFDFNSNGIRISGAFHKHLDANTNQYLSGGAYIGLVQRNVNIESLTFDDQFNGLDGYTFGTREDLPENNFAHGDIGVGLNYSVAPSDGLRLSGGVAAAHLISPSLSFFARTPDVENAVDIDQFSKITAYVSTDIAIHKRASLLPRLSWISQGPHSMLNAGTLVRFDINNHNSNALHLGGALRLTEDQGSLAPSAFSFLTAIELSTFLIGLSYDLNLDDIFNERLGQTVFELSVTYIGEYENEATFCPTF
ncbi:MAG: type IX secretion system membrane protein PorP/SprF, partial [Saprospiraceae bacterium]|nr:type IX secretion system membrane protein PorP/SprF [Saprospiraceae bacterium]